MILFLYINDLLKTRVKILKCFEYNSNGMAYDITVLQLFGSSPVHITFVCVQCNQGNMGMGLSHQNNQTMVDEHFTVQQLKNIIAQIVPF